MDISKLSPGKNPPEEINVVVEIPQGSSIKYELDKKSGVLSVDRFLYGPMDYPFNYGFIPGTRGGDSDPLDVVLVSSLAVAAGALIAARPIGMLEMEDESGPDSKVIAAPLEKIDPQFGRVRKISELSDYTRQKIKQFFKEYKELEPGKWVKIGRFLSRESALREIKKSLS
jgi:inorganic pyrophosphatase